MNVAADTEAIDPIDELLTAYLDNELHENDRAQVEARLASDAKFRKRLHELQKAWDALEFLPKSSAEPAFAETTIGMAAAVTRDDGMLAEREAKRRDFTQWCALIGGGTAIFLAMFLIASAISRNHAAQQLRDLPVVEKLPELRDLENADFLRKLKQSDLIDPQRAVGEKS